VNKPLSLGYRMPAEWESHAAVWLSWPHAPESFPQLEQAEREFAAFVAAVSGSEPVELLVLDDGMRERAGRLLAELGTNTARVRFHLQDYADIWFRDYGPIFVENTRKKQPAMIKWIFNAWGNKYESLLKDNQVAYRLRETLRLPMLEPGIVLEGGSVEVNGKGTLLTTEQCLLNSNRNPHLGTQEIERYLEDYLGTRKVIWLGDGIEGDDTDGHIDDIARFVNPTTVVCAIQEDAYDPDYTVLQRNFDLLLGAKDQDGKPLEVVPLPMPGRIAGGEGRRPASYANFYIANTKVLVPIFATENDAKALNVLRELFPDREVVGLMARNLVHGLGTFHCMSQQQPAL
jgi:agmatine deiminase